MLKKLRLMILKYIENKNLNYKIVEDKDNIFLVSVFYGKNINFKFDFILNQSTFRWNDCGFFGIYEDEFRPMTENGLNELFLIADKCIEYGYRLNIYKCEKEILSFQGVDENKEFDVNNKKFILEVLSKNNYLHFKDFDSIEYENFKQDKKISFKKDELGLSM